MQTQEMGYVSQMDDNESQKSRTLYETQSGFLKDAHEQVKLGFIRKVYAILTIQLTITFCTSYFLGKAQWFNSFANSGPGVTCYIVEVVVLIVMMCCLGYNRKLAKEVPSNYIFLFSFTLLMALLVTYVTTHYPPTTVLMTILMTVAATLALTLYALVANPLTLAIWIPILFVLIILMFVSAIFLIFYQVRWLNTLYSVLGVIVYSIFIVFDTYSTIKLDGITCDDYIYASITLYLDIITLFFYILQSLGKNSNN